MATKFKVNDEVVITTTKGRIYKEFDGQEGKITLVRPDWGGAGLHGYDVEFDELVKTAGGGPIKKTQLYETELKHYEIKETGRSPEEDFFGTEEGEAILIEDPPEAANGNAAITDDPMKMGLKV